jgi:long-chain acyl-CoA synthetase
MLYERWQQVAREHASEWAVIDVPSDRHWTFAELAHAAEKFAAKTPVTFAQGHSVDFILAVLAAWRDRSPACPLEAGQAPPTLKEVPAETAQVKLTSATTGRAKAILFTAEQMQADAENIVATMRLRPDWPNLGFISLAHSYGFSNLVTPLLLHGIPLVLASPPLPEMLRKAATVNREFTLAAVPALWQAWHEARAIPSNIRLAISAGAPLPLELERDVFASAGLKIHNFYGASECGGIAYDATEAPREDASCVGTPMRNVQLTVNVDRCLEVRSRAVGLSYFPEKETRLGNGLFVTSDLAEIVKDRVYLRGRASDLINVAGRKVAPERIERELLQHAGVRDCLVLGLPDPDPARGESIGAVIVTRTPVSEAELREFLLKRLPAWQIPRLWHFIEDLPRNERGKISRAEWRKKLSRL